MKLQTTTTEVKEIELELPEFFRSKDGYNHLAVLSETDLRMLTTINTSIWVSLREPSLNRSIIAEAMQDYEQITEEQFFEVYNKAIESLSFTPTLKS